MLPPMRRRPNAGRAQPQQAVDFALHADTGARGGDMGPVIESRGKQSPSAPTAMTVRPTATI